ncbi:MAG: stage II sporulation protein M [Flavobacteriales bacterium]
MKEASFLAQNADKWKGFEKDLSGSYLDPGRLAHIYDDLSDDLAYSRTFFPGGRSERYLNAMLARVHYRIYRNKKESGSRIIRFWVRELPEVLARSQKELFLSLLVFGVAVLIGILSQLYQPSFADIILGEGYVDQTLDNIQKGEPMQIYQSGRASEAFASITVNNVKVAFYTFVMGVLFSVGTGFILLYNGIMLGTFFTLFHQHGENFEAMTTVWLHGTLEIASIVVAGCAGLVVGNSFLFPASYPRKSSFLMGAKKGLKLVVGTVPFFIAAGFIEGFVTRMLWLPAAVKLMIILLSLVFALYYYVLYPRRLSFGS